MKHVVVTGVAGQDGQYITNLLGALDYNVVGITHSDKVVMPCCGPAHLIQCDLRHEEQIQSLIRYYQPIHVYHLAARASSSQLFNDPLGIAETNSLATIRILEAIREESPNTRFLFASSSEIFAGCNVSPQDETTQFSPVNAYGAAKAFSMHIVNAYRSQFGLYACSAILYNHESPLRKPEYVTRKITGTVAKILLGLETELILGDLNSRRDWGFAGDYVEAMWLMLQQDQPGDYVVATGETHTVREFCDVAFSHVGLDYRDYVKTDPNFVRRSDSVELRGNAEKARRSLGWSPKVSFAELVKMMVDADVGRLRNKMNHE
jgi:GDPmannose 4,6-dehydratase